jgi:hypothetical protein
MAITGLTLNDPARGLVSVIKPRAGVALQGLEFTATVRESAEDYAQADGSLDTTAYLGAGAVSVAISIPSGDRSLMDELAAYLVPWSRPYLQVTDSGWASPRLVRLRFDTHQHPITTGTGLRRDIQYSWKAPRGVWEDTTTQVFILGGDVPDSTGLIFTDSAGATVTDNLGYVFNPSTSAGESVVTVVGTARPAWRARLYGPATGPALANDTTGQAMAFLNTLALGPGDYLELNSGPGDLAKTANLNGDPSASRLAFLDFAQSVWFPLDPGPNRLRYHAAGGATTSTQCELTIWPVWMP